MNYIFENLNQNNINQFLKLLLPSAAALIDAPNCNAWFVSLNDKTPLGCLVALNENGHSYLRNIFISPTFRRHKLATQLFNLWEQDCKSKKIQQLNCFVTLQQNELEIFSKFLSKQNFRVEKFQGEIFTFNPYTILKSKFIQKTLARKTPYIPKNWRVVRYINLSAHDLTLLRKSKSTVFPEDFDFDLDFQHLELQQSFAFFCKDDVVGYITQRRITKNIASVPIFAANQSYRGAGLIILKYYMFAVHFETPEIFQIKCHFTPKTETGRNLFLHYTENKFLRHSLEYSFNKQLP